MIKIAIFVVGVAPESAQVFAIGVNHHPQLLLEHLLQGQEMAQVLLWISNRNEQEYTLTTDRQAAIGHILDLAELLLQLPIIGNGLVAFQVNVQTNSPAMLHQGR